MSRQVTREDIVRAVEDLFTNGAGEEASRLVLMLERPGAKPLNLGGWGRQPMIDALTRMLLEEEGTPP